MDFDLALCAAVMSTGDLTTVLNRGIGSSQLEGLGAAAFAEIVEHRRKYGQLPDRDLLFAKYPPLEAVFNSLPKEPVAFFCDNVSKRWLLTQVADSLKQMAGTIGRRDPQAALDMMKEILFRTREWRGRLVNACSIVDDAEERIEWYKRVTEFSGGTDGISWPWPFLNTETQGIHPGEFYVFPGLVGSGKTWSLIECLHCVAAQRLTSLVISMELPLQQIGRRFDARYMHVPYDHIKKGMLGTEGYERYVSVLRDYKNTLPQIWMYGRPTVNRVSDIDMLIQEHKPSILFIDSLYLLREGNAEGRFVQTIESVELIKPLALTYDIGVVGTTQFKFDQKTAGRVRQGKGEMEDMGYAGGALGAIADGVYGLFSTDDTKRQKNRIIRILKRRESADDGMEGFVINWDFERMDFSEVGLWNGQNVVRHDAASSNSSVPF